MEFDAYGALRVYAEGEVLFPGAAQEISWIGVDRKITDNAAVNEATLRFVLPRSVDPGETFIQGAGQRRTERPHRRWSDLDLDRARPGEG
ncbi:MAG: hypothetical protein U0075_05950 [Thermomicrobiales bacterium]